MLKKSIISIIAVMVLMTISVSSSNATLITLDSVANATSWSEDKTRTYLNVWDKTNSTYYYQWKYDGSASLQWNSMDELVADLSTKGFAWWLESGGDPFNDPASVIWKSISMAPGTYTISLAKNSSAYNLIDYWGGDMWNAYVQISTDNGDNFNFGDGLLSFDSESSAIAYYHLYVDGLTLDLHQDTEMFFYINDNNSVDNSGSVTLDIETTAVPEPATVIMLASGFLTLISLRHKQKARQSA